MEPYVNKEVWELQLAHLKIESERLHQKLDEILVQTKITNGNVSRHEASIAKIWTIGSTAWAIIAAAFATFWATK